MMGRGFRLVTYDLLIQLSAALFPKILLSPQFEGIVNIVF
jgi:hypothetical protein